MIKFIHHCVCCDHPHECGVTPATAPYPTSNPDDPRYSDPGDPGDLDVPTECAKCGEIMEQGRLYMEAMDAIELTYERPEDRDAWDWDMDR